MALYECVFIARQDLSSNQVDELVDQYKKIITDHKGSVSRTEYWGLKKLAYEIKKNSRGHYTSMNIDAPFDAIEEMERQMRINEDLLRYLTLKVDAFDEEPSIMMQHKTTSTYNRREDRGAPREERAPAKTEAPTPVAEETTNE